MRMRLITPPASEPVTLAEAKAHLRIETAVTDDDTYVTALIVAARMYAEQYCWRGFVTQTWDAILDGFPDADEIELQFGILQTLTSINYVDENGNTQTLDAGEYVTDDASIPGRVLLVYGKSWPATREQWNAVTIRVVLGQAVANVAMPIKQAVLLLVSQMYENRTPEVSGTTVSPVKFAFEALLAPYRLVTY